jgi:DNA-binding CsgD family transcriptional regulator
MSETGRPMHGSERYVQNGEMRSKRRDLRLPVIGAPTPEKQRIGFFARESVGAAAAPAMDLAAKNAMPAQPLPRNPARTLAMSMPGLLLLGPQKDLMASNAEAIRILCYPDAPNRRQLNALVANRIPLEQLRARANANTTAEFLSGRRRYICSAHHLDLQSSTKGTTAILLERVSSPEATLYGIAKRYNLTNREREAMGHLLRGLTSKEIAQQMRISPNTVKAFLHSAMTKMGVSTRAGLIGRIAGTTPKEMHGYRDLLGIRGP